MKNLLKKWKGKIIIGKEEVEDVDYKDGEEIDILLVPKKSKRRKIHYYKKDDLH